MATIQTAVDIDINVKGGQSVNQTTEALNNLNTATEQVSQGAESAQKSMGLLGRAANSTKGAFQSIGNNFNKLGKDLGGIPGPVGLVAQSMGGLVKAFQAIVANPVGLVIMGIVGALAALKRAFSDSEAGQEKWNRITAVGSALLGNLMDVVADLGEFLIKLFSDPLGSLVAFGELVKAQIINRFNGLLELIPNIGKAIGYLFEGEFAKAGQTAANAVGKVVLGLEDTIGTITDAIDAVKDFGKENLKEAKAAAEVAEMRNKAHRLERQLLVDRADQEAAIAELRLKARQEDEYTAEQRKKFILEAQTLEDGLLKREVEVAKLRYEAQKLENTFSRTNIENADKEASAQAELSNITTRRLTQQRATQRELNRVNKEIERDNNAAIKAAENASKAEAKLAEDRLKLLEDGRKSEYDQALKDLETYYQERQTLLNKSLLDETMTQEEYNQKLVELEIEKLNAQLIAQADYGQDSTKTEQDLSQKLVDIKAKANEDKNASDQARADLEQQLYDQTVGLSNALISLIGEQTKVGKAIGLAQIAADTARALSGALANANSPTPDNIASGGLAGIAKYITLATTIATNSKRAIDILKKGDVSGSVGISTSTQTPSFQPPTFQASTLGQDFSGGTRVYVTEGDISRTQKRVNNLQRVSVVGG